MINIAVFASGTGSNAVNIVKTFNSGSRLRVALCLTDRENAPVIDKMKELGVETEYFPREVWRNSPEEILDTLRAHDICIIALAGFLCFVSDPIVNAYEGRILNIHPSLLPAYGGKGMHGKNVHKAVIEGGETKSGATVHVVTPAIDMGPIVGQKEVPVLPDDTPETLEARVHEAEYELYPEAIAKVAMSVAKPEPPALPKSVDDEWADALGVANNVPPVPSGSPSAGSSEPQIPYSRPQASHFSNNAVTPASGQMPPTWLAWSVVMTILCCFIPGIVAIIYSSKVSGKFYAGDLDGAWRASRSAEIWIIVSFVLGVITNTLYIPLTIAGLL